jgi:hypothetical protein
MLQLKKIKNIRRNRPDIEFFSSWRNAVSHILNHLLTYPECLAWAELIEDLADFVDVRDDNQRFRCAREYLKEEGRYAQPLYERYKEQTQLALTDARRLGWWGESEHGNDDPATAGSDTIGSTDESIEFLGICGIYGVAGENSIKTAYLAGQTSIWGKVLQEMPTAKNPLPREGRCAVKPQWRRMKDRRARMADQKRKEKWSRLERVYYLLFRRAVQDVRCRFHDTSDMQGRREKGMAALRRRMPRMSQLDFPSWRKIWQELRERPGRQSVAKQEA